jgi:hypothetical protein
MTQQLLPNSALGVLVFVSSLAGPACVRCRELLDLLTSGSPGSASLLQELVGKHAMLLAEPLLELMAVSLDTGVHSAVLQLCTVLCSAAAFFADMMTERYGTSLALLLVSCHNECFAAISALLQTLTPAPLAEAPAIIQPMLCPGCQHPITPAVRNLDHPG